MTRRWSPFACTVIAVSAILLAAHTSIVDLTRYAAYAVLTVALPGTLLYRGLRRRPHTFVEDVAMGVAVGLCLELAAWAVFSALNLRSLVWLWPLAVVLPFALVPRLRRHWRVRGYTPTPLGWSWSVAGVVTFFTAYLSAVFLERNPVLPAGENTQQYVDLAYQLSLAGEAKHHFPPAVPQVAGEPLYYHWFGYAHMAMVSMVGHIDLTVVSLRLAVPALCAAAIVLSAVVGWRITGRPYVGVVAAVLFWVVGEVNFDHPVTTPFGTQATFVVWHGMSMTYSWVLLLALIAALADILRGQHAYVLAALFAFASSGAKASSLPVTLGALAFTGTVLLLTQRRIPWRVIIAGVIVGAAWLFATAVLFRFQAYGLEVDAFGGLDRYWGHHGWPVVAAVWAAFLINMQLRLAGIIPLLWLRRARLDPVEWFLLGGALAGTVLYLTFRSVNAQYFTRAGFTFGVLLSAWGYALVVDRARLPRTALAAGSAVFAFLLVAVQIGLAGPAPTGESYSPVVPILMWSAVLLAAGLLAAAIWRWVPSARGRGAVVALTAILLVGIPGLIMDAYKSVRHPNGGPYFNTALPRSQVEAARWVRDHSSADDVLATNVHCRQHDSRGCDSRSFWLSAYAERSVLVEGWGFAPRTSGHAHRPFWNPNLLRLNDSAFTTPTAETIGRLEKYGVRWLVVDRDITQPSPVLPRLAKLRYANSRVSVYQLG